MAAYRIPGFVCDRQGSGVLSDGFKHVVATDEISAWSHHDERVLNKRAQQPKDILSVKHPAGRGHLLDSGECRSATEDAE